MPEYLVPVAIGGTLFLLLLLLLFRPTRVFVKGIARTLGGLLGLCTLNLAGVGLGVNLLNALIIGVLGLPGLGALLVISLLC